MRGKLFFSALTKYLLGLLLTGLLLFLPAGTLHYANGWLFIVLLFAPMLILGAVMLVKAPELLQKRLSTREKEKTQKNVVGLSGILFFVGFLAAGLDYRFGWTHVPVGVVVAASVVLLVSYALYAEVMRENAYLSRTIEVQEGQTVVDTGLYRIIRHPMYAVTLWLFLAIPLVLGSWISFILFLPYPILIILRIRNEEAVLTRDLVGYDTYKRKVKYRLIPFIW